MVIKVREELEVPLRHRNDILMAAGHAPAYSESSLDQPSMSSIARPFDGVSGVVALRCFCAELRQAGTIQHLQP